MIYRINMLKHMRILSLNAPTEFIGVDHKHHPNTEQPHIDCKPNNHALKGLVRNAAIGIFRFVALFFVIHTFTNLFQYMLNIDVLCEDLNECARYKNSEK